MDRPVRSMAVPFVVGVAVGGGLSWLGTPLGLAAGAGLSWAAGLALAVRAQDRYPESSSSETTGSFGGFLAVFVPAIVGVFTAPVPFPLGIGLLALVYGTAFTAMIVGIRIMLERANRQAAPSFDGSGSADD